MSQVSKKPVSLPLRKRLRPTVNLNVACRRRNNAKDVPSLTDRNLPISDESSTNVEDNSGSISLAQEVDGSVTKGVHDNTINSEDKLLDSSFESKVSVESDASTIIIKNEILLIGDSGNNEPNQNKSIDSTASTVILPSCLENVSDILDKVRNKSLNQSFETDRSISSSVSTIILNEKDYGGTKHPEKDNSLYVVEKASISVDTRSSRIISNIKQSEDVSDESRSEGKAISVMGNVREENETLIDDAISLSSDKDNGYISNSVSVRTSPVPDLNRSNTDCESLLEDDTSSVLSFRSGCSMLPPKFRKRQRCRSSRLYDARKEFEAKYVNTKPERSSLRMLDLIYYNPASNPMKSSPDSNQGIVVSSVSTDVAEEDADDPGEPENGEDEGNRVPAPRVKVGPNGELVLDEQSLVIETTQSKKSRKEIANLTVVIDSGSNTTYHTYSKKKKRRSDWSVQETVRFYKALQSIGTDFSLMQSLFPSRSRVDLKTKYKREERINGPLIEKALRFPSLFDLSELEKEEEQVKIEVVVNEKKENKKIIKKNNKKVISEKKRPADSLGFDDGDKVHLQDKKKKKTETSKCKTRPRRKRRNEVNHEVRDESNSDDCSDDEYRPIKRTLPLDSAKILEGVNTRPKRVSDHNRPNYAAIENGDSFLEGELNMLDTSHNDEELEEELQDDYTSAGEEDVEEASHEAVVENALNDLPVSLEGLAMTNVQPGSIVLLTTQCPDNPGYQICNVFMVQDNSTGSNQSDMSSNINNCLSLPSSEVNPSNVNSTDETQPS